jgi:hypothetical protein
MQTTLIPHDEINMTRFNFEAQIDVTQNHGDSHDFDLNVCAFC